MSYLEGMLEALWRTDRPSRKRRILAFSYYDWLQPATINMLGTKNREELVAEPEDSTLVIKTTFTGAFIPSRFIYLHCI
jgi:hypothetical protein